MKKIGIKRLTGLLAALLAFIIMCFTAVSCGSYIKNNVELTSEYQESEYSPEMSESGTEKPVTESTGDGTSSGDAVTTDSIETTESPETTKAPETTKTPETTKKPETTKAPETTKKPETTKAPETTAPPEEVRKVLNYDNMKAMWISQYDLNSVYTDSGRQRSEASYKLLIRRILDNVKKDGFNTVILQVRPNADSMYESEYYPLSKYVVGKYGQSMSYDPVEIFLGEAHARGLSVQAWINPMRGMSTTEIKSVPSNFPIKKWYDDSATNGKYVVTVKNVVYLNPAYEEVRNLIVNGAREIMTRYDFDGLHMDDYFYPTQDASFDKAAYDAYKSGGGKAALALFRKDCLNKLVSSLYSMTKSVNSELLYGISPAGNISTVTNQQYADVHTWCSKPGYIDYICPQVYFGLEHQNYSFESVSKTWQNIIKLDSVDLIIGMSLGKAVNGYDGSGDQYAGTGKNEWINNKDVLVRCLEKTKNYKDCRGVAYFCYQYFYSPTGGSANVKTEEERSKFIPLLKEITWVD